ncbi:MAG: hypothetical protein HY704_01980 [Gemmatimonadetes bacterium]|nr:hypothetical protein [Gemmatimonadota bacterium]
MNPAHLHLLVNHLPVIGLIIAILLLAAATLARSGALVRASLGLLVFLAFAAVAVYLTGEGAEEVVERLPDVDDAFIEGHEEAALVAAIATGALGVVSLAGLWRFRRPRTIPGRFAILLLILSLVPAALLTWTAHLGGRIRHQEARPGWSAPAGAEEAEEEVPSESAP